jgi:hypothetical protein
MHWKGFFFGDEQWMSSGVAISNLQKLVKNKLNGHSKSGIVRVRVSCFSSNIPSACYAFAFFMSYMNFVNIPP